jgi:hypothetical protein
MGKKKVKEQEVQTVNAGYALGLAMSALDGATALAEDRQDPELMIKIAAEWRLLSGSINVLQRQELEDSKANIEIAELYSQTDIVNKTGFSPR